MENPLSQAQKNYSLFCILSSSPNEMRLFFCFFIFFYFAIMDEEKLFKQIHNFTQCIMYDPIGKCPVRKFIKIKFVLITTTIFLRKLETHGILSNIINFKNYYEKLFWIFHWIMRKFLIGTRYAYSSRIYFQNGSFCAYTQKKLTRELVFLVRIRTREDGDA